MRRSSIFQSTLITRKGQNSAQDFGLYHPLSYYILGGSDPTGEALKNTNEVSFESEEMIATAGTPDSRTDPRVSRWEVIEAIGVSAYEKMLDNTVSQQKPNNE